jgi:hypothetical protein
MPSITFFENFDGELVSAPGIESEPAPRRRPLRCRECRETGHNAKNCEKSQRLRPERTGGRWCRWCSGLAHRRPRTGCPGCAGDFTPEVIVLDPDGRRSPAGLLLEE